MTDQNLREKVLRMSKTLTDEAIAGALKVTVETVREIREGDAQIEEINDSFSPGKSPSIIINSTKPSYRQKIISIWRAKGGVGCTAVAMNLARHLSESVDTVALVDLNFQNGPTDLTYYLDLPAEPNMLHFQQGYGLDSFLRVEKNLFVLQAPYNRYHFNDLNGLVSELLIFCRKEFDAVVFDLPNTDEDYVKETVRQSNTIVMVMEGTCAEMLRMEIKSKNIKNKDKIVLVRNSETGRAGDVIETHKVISLPYDKYLPEALENQAFCKRKTPFNKTIAQLKTEIYEQKGKGLLGRLASKK